jgi:demethylmenaquinone methyltransferase / 2-methoxy-6-polyprenyl-1,4-benzoquinol methylase
LPASSDIRRMFDCIVGRYDRLNRVLSLGLDRSWRRALAGAAGHGAGGPVLDLCCGTGDVSAELLRSGPIGSTVFAADFSPPMCRAAWEKLCALPAARSRWDVLCADGLRLPFPDCSFGAAVVAFGVRNFEDLDRGLSELARVLRPGGFLGLLEFAPPRRALLRLAYRPYLRIAVPLLGRLLSGAGGAYSYLSSSIESFLAPEQMSAALLRDGFRDPSAKPLALGITFLYTARRE